jgi:hypothetical protein
MTVKILSVDTMPEIDPYHRDTQGLTLTEITIDPEDMDCHISQEYDNNSTSIDKWNGMIIGRKLNGTLDGDDCKDFLESEDGQVLLTRICDGWSADYNGNNYVGGLDDDAQNALDELVEDLESFYSNKETWTCDDYFQNLDDAELGISALATDDEIKVLAENLEKDSDAYLIDDVESYLVERRDEAKKELESE